MEGLSLRKRKKIGDYSPIIPLVTAGLVSMWAFLLSKIIKRKKEEYDFIFIIVI